MRSTITKYKTRPTKAARHFRFIPHGNGRWQLDMLEPGELIFADINKLDFKTRGGKKYMLLMLDVATGGLHIKGIKHKHKVGKHFDEYIVEESSHKREIRVTVGADGDGAMALVKDAARKRGVAFLPIPPYARGHHERAVSALVVAAMHEDVALPRQPCSVHQALLPNVCDMCSDLEDVLVTLDVDDGQLHHGHTVSEKRRPSGCADSDAHRDVDVQLLLRGEVSGHKVRVCAQVAEPVQGLSVEHHAFEHVPRC